MAGEEKSIPHNYEKIITLQILIPLLGIRESHFFQTRVSWEKGENRKRIHLDFHRFHPNLKNSSLKSKIQPLTFVSFIHSIFLECRFLPHFQHCMTTLEFGILQWIVSHPINHSSIWHETHKWEKERQGKPEIEESENHIVQSAY